MKKLVYLMVFLCCCFLLYLAVHRGSTIPGETTMRVAFSGDVRVENKIIVVPAEGKITFERGAKITFINGGIVSYAAPEIIGEDDSVPVTISGEEGSLFYGLAFPGLTIELRKMVFKNLRLAYRRTEFLRPIGSSHIAYSGSFPLVPPSVPVDVAFMMYAANIKLVDSIIAGISNPNEEAVETSEDYKWLRRAAVFIADTNIEMTDSVFEDISNLSRQASGSLTFTAWNSVHTPMTLNLERCVFTRVKLTQLQSEGACRISDCIFSGCTCEAYVEKNMSSEDYVGCTYIYASREVLIYKSKFLKFSFSTLPSLSSLSRDATFNSAFIHTRRQKLSSIDISNSLFEIECMMPIAIVSAEELENKLHPVLEIRNNVFHINGLWGKQLIQRRTADFYIFWETLENAIFKDNVMLYNTNVSISMRGVRISGNRISGQDIKMIVLFDDSCEDDEQLISFYENTISAENLSFILLERFGVREHNDKWRIIIKDCVLHAKKITSTKNFILASDTGEAVIEELNP